MKRFIKAFAALFFATCMLAGCADSNASTSAGNGVKSGEKKSVVVTIFPEYDWVRNIIGDCKDNYDITMLLDNGVDLHSYQPTAVDIAKIAECDMFIYVGGESDEWVEDALSEAVNKDMQVLNLLEILGDSVKEEEIKEGMEHDHDHDHEHVDGDEDHDHEYEDGDEDHDHEDGDENHDHEHHHGEEPEMDEHVWLSLRNASVICSSIEQALEKIDPDNADAYKANLSGYVDKLNALDGKYVDAVSSASVKTLLFGDRFPFRYLVDDYGLDYYAAFVGCSAESEASFETIVFLSGKVDELGLKHIMTIESSDGKIADTIIENTAAKDQDVLMLDSMQSTTSKNVTDGATYLSVMEKNLEVLQNALN